MMRGRRAIGFDLDYTLYDQDDFARSYFAAVAESVGERTGTDSGQVEKVLNATLDLLTLYHPNLYDEALRNLGVDDPGLVADLVAGYHNHRPQIRTYEDVDKTLAYLTDAGYRLFLVTDGNSGTQRYKVDALGISRWFEEMIFTGDFPGEKRKPDPFPFELALERLRLRAEECVYVGDNPLCDFIAPRRLGMVTVGVMTGPFCRLPVRAESSADVSVPSIRELRSIL